MHLSKCDLTWLALQGMEWCLFSKWTAFCSQDSCEVLPPISLYLHIGHNITSLPQLLNPSIFGLFLFYYSLAMKSYSRYIIHQSLILLWCQQSCQIIQFLKLLFDRMAVSFKRRSWSLEAHFKRKVLDACSDWCWWLANVCKLIWRCLRRIFHQTFNLHFLTVISKYSALFLQEFNQINFIILLLDNHQFIQSSDLKLN